MQSQVPPLGEKSVGFEIEGVRYETTFAKLDALLLGWQRNTLPENIPPGEYIAKELGWSRPLTDAELVGFSKQMDKIRQEWLESRKKEVLDLIQSGKVSDPPAPPGALEMLHTKNSLDVGALPSDVPRFNETPVSIPIGNRVAPFSSEEDRAEFIMDVATMVLFMIRVSEGFPIEDWGLAMMQRAGCSPKEVERASEILRKLRRG